MTIEGKGKYLGKRKIELEEDLNLLPNTEIFFIIEECKPLEMFLENKEHLENINNHPLLQMAEHAVHLGRADLSEKYHDVLYNIE